MSKWLFYNIFRFESYLRVLFHYPAYVLFERPIISNIVETKDQNETFRIRVTDVLKHQRGTTAPRLVSLTVILLFLTPWNLLCALFQMQSKTAWFGGWIFASVAALIVIMKADNPRRFLKDFKKNELRTQKGLRKSAFVAFLIMLIIWSVFFLTSFYSFARA